MDTISLTLYAMIQGICELFPVSSSGHLILFTKLTGQKDPGLFMDVAVHGGSLLALCLYFWRDIKRLIKGLWDFLTGRSSKESLFFWTLVLATIPVVVVGFVVDRYGHQTFRSLKSFAWASLFFGGLLYLTDKLGDTRKHVRDISRWQAFIGWGIAQCFALIHGASRSGVTITFGRAAGYSRPDALRFSFLMAIPTLTAAFVLKGAQLYAHQTPKLLQQASYGALISFLTGFALLWLLNWWVRRFTFQIFGIYRILLGAFLLWGIYLGGWSF